MTRTGSCSWYRAGADVQAVLRAALAAGPVEHFGYELGGLVDIYRELALRSAVRARSG